MPLDPTHLMSLGFTTEKRAYDDRDTMHYALSVGMGCDPFDASELRYVYEGGGLKTLPTQASVLAAFQFMDQCGWDQRRILHGEERLTLHRPLAHAGNLLIDSEVTAVYDQGVDHGALVYLQCRARSEADGRPVFTSDRTIVALGDGGCGAPEGSGPSPHPIPDRPPDLSCTLKTRPDQALLYRLGGSRNPIYADPAAAREAGFPGPILQGLCTYGIACRAVLETICEYDHTLITQFNARFTAPVFPGDAILTQMWQDANVVSFQASCPERNTIVLDNGLCILAS